MELKHEIGRRVLFARKDGVVWSRDVYVTRYILRSTPFYFVELCIERKFFNYGEKKIKLGFFDEKRLMRMMCVCKKLGWIMFVR